MLRGKYCFYANFQEPCSWSQGKEFASKCCKLIAFMAPILHPFLYPCPLPCDFTVPL